MSEYQYYEFRAVDAPLTEEEMGELRAVSSRADITPTSFVNVYNWGDFKGDPDEWMEDYFDAFLYLANWGTRWLMFRIPKGLVDAEAVSEYRINGILSFRSRGDWLVVSIQTNEEFCDWVDGEGWLSSLMLLRSGLIQGDHRCLYLGWLIGAQNGELEDDTLEPPVPPGLESLNIELETLAELMEIDADLIEAAAEGSAEEPDFGLSDDAIAEWVAELPVAEKNAILTKLVTEANPHIATQLKRRAIGEIRKREESGAESQHENRRTVAEIRARAEAIAKERKEREARRRVREEAKREKARAEKRKKLLDSLFGKELELWKEVNHLIATTQPKNYDEAVATLLNLRDLAERQGERLLFAKSMTELARQHARKPTLIERFKKANLVD